MTFFPTDSLYDDEIRLSLIRTAPARPEKHFLPAYHFYICLSDGTRIGNCDLRVGHNEKTYIGGNIGYTVAPAYRGHHYAAKACRLLFTLARRHGLDHLYITCAPDNIASYKTCEACGGELVEIAPIPETNEMYAEGKRYVRVYRFSL